MDTAEIIAMLNECADAIRHGLEGIEDWRALGGRAGQYDIDITADRIGVQMLTGFGFGVLSEESGVHDPDRSLFAVIDPVDGSTNASRQLPWYATSICVLDEIGPLAAVVVNQATLVRFEATRDGGALRDGKPIRPSSVQRLDRAIVGLSGYPRAYFGWSQYRALGAIALDLCAVADGSLDGYLDCVDSSHGPWDYLAGMFISERAGAVVGETRGRDLVVRGFADRRSPVAAGTVELFRELGVAARSLGQR